MIMVFFYCFEIINYKNSKIYEVIRYRKNVKGKEAYSLFGISLLLVINLRSMAYFTVPKVVLSRKWHLFQIDCSFLCAAPSTMKNNKVRKAESAQN